MIIVVVKVLYSLYIVIKGDMSTFFSFYETDIKKIRINNSTWINTRRIIILCTIICFKIFNAFRYFA